MKKTKTKTKTKKQAVSAITVVSFNLDKDINQRLTELAKRTGRSKTFYFRQAITRHLEALEQEFEKHKISLTNRA